MPTSRSVRGEDKCPKRWHPDDECSDGDFWTSTSDGFVEDGRSMMMNPTQKKNLCDEPNSKNGEINGAHLETLP